MLATFTLLLGASASLLPAEAADVDGCPSGLVVTTLRLRQRREVGVALCDCVSS